MYHQVFRILERDEAEWIVRGLAEREFADGKATASGRAREIKHNLQVSSEDR
jgi:predicted 2-oxoglutarate/Fe(II)-dependent dioxygenase YbiX